MDEVIVKLDAALILSGALEDQSSLLVSLRGQGIWLSSCTRQPCTGFRQLSGGEWQ